MRWLTCVFCPCLECWVSGVVVKVVMRERTLMAQLHLHLEVAKLVGDAGLGLGTDLLAGPLLDSIESLVDIHGGGCVCVCVFRVFSRSPTGDRKGAVYWLVDRSRMLSIDSVLFYIKFRRGMSRSSHDNGFEVLVLSRWL